MLNKIKRMLGLKGSWSWAIKQMKAGKVIRNSANSGSVIMKLDDIHNGRIVWDFRYFSSKLDDNTPKWESANIFMRDFDTTTYVIVDAFTHLPTGTNNE